MRQRRIERCLLLAHEALDDGLEETARIALDEARTLDPDTPSFDTFYTVALAEHRAATAAARWATFRRLAAVAAIVAALGTGAFWLWGSGQKPDPAPAAVSAAGPAPSPAAPAPADASNRAAPPVAPRPLAPSPRTELRQAGGPQPAATGTTGSPAPQPPAEQLPERLPLVAELAAPAVAPPTAPAPPSVGAPEPSVEAEEAKVRAVLSAFEAAYSSLSASAARAVWPTVDQPSLARAFAKLASQHLSLEECSVTIAGETARAACAGTTTWTSKIGGGVRTTPRYWQFDLAAANGAWHIVRAEAR